MSVPAPSGSCPQAPACTGRWCFTAPDPCWKKWTTRYSSRPAMSPACPGWSVRCMSCRMPIGATVSPSVAWQPSTPRKVAWCRRVGWDSIFPAACDCCSPACRQSGSKPSKCRWPRRSMQRFPPGLAAPAPCAWSRMKWRRCWPVARTGRWSRAMEHPKIYCAAKRVAP